MKRFVAFILALSMVFALCACGSSKTQTETPKATPKPTPVPTAKDKLNAEELMIFNTFIAVTKDYSDPSKARIIEVGNYEPRSITVGQGPDTVIIRIQGENVAGGTGNKYYILVLNGGEITGEGAEERIAFWAARPRAKDMMLQLKAKTGEYAETEDGDLIKNWRDYDKVDVGNLNRAIQEYWENKGF